MVWEAGNLPCKFAVICFKVQPNQRGTAISPDLCESPKDGCRCHLTGWSRGDGVTPSCTAWQSGVGDLIVGMLGETSATGCLTGIFIWVWVGLTKRTPSFCFEQKHRYQVWHSRNPSFAWSFIEAQNGPKRAFIRLMTEGLELVFLSFVCWWTSGSFQMIHKLMWKAFKVHFSSFWAVVILLLVIFGVEEGIYNSVLSSIVHKCVSNEKNGLDDLCRGEQTTALFVIKTQAISIQGLPTFHHWKLKNYSCLRFDNGILTRLIMQGTFHPFIALRSLWKHQEIRKVFWNSNISRTHSGMTWRVDPRICARSISCEKLWQDPAGGTCSKISQLDGWIIELHI